MLGLLRLVNSRPTDGAAPPGLDFYFTKEMEVGRATCLRSLTKPAAPELPRHRYPSALELRSVGRSPRRDSCMEYAAVVTPTGPYDL